MNKRSHDIINHLGGTTAVAKLIKTPISTVHSWRKIGIPASRLDHIRLAAKRVGLLLPGDLDRQDNAE